MGNRQKERYQYYEYDFDSDYDSDYDYDYVNTRRARMEGNRTVLRDEPRDDRYGPVERARRDRYEDVDPDQYAVVPAKPNMSRAYDEERPMRKAILSPQEAQEREMSQLKMEEQKIKNKIASERLSFDVQKRQQAKELHDIKVAVIKKYPSVLLNKQAEQ